MMDPRELELYLHIPFCKRKCNYCDFVSFAGCEKQFDLYVEALCREIRQSAPFYRDRDVVSIYIGGGTPSILDCGQITTLVDTLNREFRIRGTHEKRKGLFLQKKVRPAVEFSIEINPGTVDKEKLRTYRRLGINRLSIGLQSTDSEDLKVLGRIHTCEDFVRAYETAREVGFDNINVDLMQSIPGQTLIGWERVLAIVCTWKPEHISAYSLIVEEGTYFGELQKQGKLFLPEEETERQIYAYTKEFLEKSGYQRYEISNYAKPGYACVHNIGYWKRRDYLGLGLNASSLIRNTRWKNTADLDRYLAAFLRLEEMPETPFGVRSAPGPQSASGVWFASGTQDMPGAPGMIEEQETLSMKEQMEEYIMLGLRLTEGISKTEFLELFHQDFSFTYEAVIRRMRELRLLEEKGDRIFLTDAGVDVSNRVIGEFLV